MPFVRCSRDKRGYEHIYLMHASARRGKPAKPRLLYWFRTPPGVRMGREPFDETVRKTLESQHPGVVFDWKKLSNIPAPPPDVEHWRERRRAEKAAKQARRSEAEPASAAEAGGEAEIDDLPRVADVQESMVSAEAALENVSENEAEDEGETTPDEQSASPAAPELAQDPTAAQRPAGARRRRRRGGRRRHRRPDGAPSTEGGPTQVPEASAASPGDDEPSKSVPDGSKEE